MLFKCFRIKMRGDEVVPWHTFGRGRVTSTQFFSTIILHQYLDQKIAFFQTKNVDLQDLLVYLIFSCYI